MNPCAYFTLTLSCHILIYLKSFISSEMHGGSLGEDITGGQIKEKWGGGGLQMGEEKKTFGR